MQNPTLRLGPCRDDTRLDNLCRPFALRDPLAFSSRRCASMAVNRYQRIVVFAVFVSAIVFGAITPHEIESRWGQIIVLNLRQLLAHFREVEFGLAKSVVPLKLCRIVLIASRSRISPRTESAGTLKATDPFSGSLGPTNER
jgi:hypothetical protein